MSLAGHYHVDSMNAHTQSHHIVSDGPLPYVVAGPLGRGSDLHPVLCFLHGYDEAAPAAIETAPTRHGPLSARSDPIARERFVIVAPQLPRRGDDWYRYADAIEAIVRAVQGARAGDPRRTYLTGFSFGGNGVFDLALALPAMWAALWSVDPTRVPREAPRVPAFLSVGSAARGRVAGFTRVLGLQHVPSSIAMSEMPSDADRLLLDEGLDHAGSAATAYATRAIYEWLLARSAAAEHVPS